MTGRIALGILGVWALSMDARGEALNLYEWMATAPIVVAAGVIDEQAGFVEAEVLSSLRGSLTPGQRILVDRKRANRERAPGGEPLDLERDRAYLLLLRPGTARKRAATVPYDIVRGTEGARALPAEGRDAAIAAAARLAEIQTLRDDRLVWGALGDALRDPNPTLLRTSLALHVKFRRGDESLLEVLRPLLTDPSPDLRRDAATLAGQILGRRPADDARWGEEGDILFDLMAVARRDEVAAVRTAATRAIGTAPGDRVAELLGAIADTDPDQEVRYEAERSILERRGSPRR